MPGTTRYSATFDRTYEEADRPDPEPPVNARRSRSLSWQANSGLDGRPYTPLGGRFPTQRSSSTDNGPSKGAEHIPTRTVAKTAVKAHNNPFQFVAVGTCPLYKRAEEQLKKAKEVKKKDVLKEEEEEWQSNLDSWKSRRRKMSEDIFRRQEEIKQFELEEQIAEVSQKKTKTFSEMVESRAQRGRALSLCLLTSPMELQNWEIESRSHKNGSNSTFSGESEENSTVNSEDEGVSLKDLLGKSQKESLNGNYRNNSSDTLSNTTNQNANGDYKMPNIPASNLNMKSKEGLYIDSGLESISSSHRAGDTPDSGSDFSQDSGSSIDCDSPRTGVNVLEDFNTKLQKSRGEEIRTKLNLNKKCRYVDVSTLHREENHVTIETILEYIEVDLSKIFLSDQILKIDNHDIVSKKFSDVVSILQRAVEKGNVDVVLWRHLKHPNQNEEFQNYEKEQKLQNNADLVAENGLSSVKYEKSIESENEMYVDDFEELERQILLSQTTTSEGQCQNSKDDKSVSMSNKPISNKTTSVISSESKCNGYSNKPIVKCNENPDFVASKETKPEEKKVQNKKFRKKAIGSLTVSSTPPKISKGTTTTCSLFPLSPVTELPSPADETKSISSTISSVVTDSKEILTNGVETNISENKDSFVSFSKSKPDVSELLDSASKAASTITDTKKDTGNSTAQTNESTANVESSPSNKPKTIIKRKIKVKKDKTPQSGAVTLPTEKEKMEVDTSKTQSKEKAQESPKALQKVNSVQPGINAVTESKNMEDKVSKDKTLQSGSVTLTSEKEKSQVDASKAQTKEKAYESSKALQKMSSVQTSINVVKESKNKKEDKVTKDKTLQLGAMTVSSEKEKTEDGTSKTQTKVKAYESPKGLQKINNVQPVITATNESRNKREDKVTKEDIFSANVSSADVKSIASTSASPDINRTDAACCPLTKSIETKVKVEEKKLLSDNTAENTVKTATNQKKLKTKPKKNANIQNDNSSPKESSTNEDLNVIFQSNNKATNHMNSNLGKSISKSCSNVSDVLPVEKIAEEMERLILEQLEEEERAKELSSEVQGKSDGSADHMLMAPPKLAEPPKEKPPPPPSVNESPQKDKSLKRVNSTKRIKKEIYKRRSNFLGIENADESAVCNEPSIPPPPALEDILKAEMELDRISRMQIESAAMERLTLEENEILRKEKEIIEHLESEERRKQLLSESGVLNEGASEFNSERKSLVSEHQFIQEQKMQLLEEQQLREREEFIRKQEDKSALSPSDPLLSTAAYNTEQALSPPLSLSGDTSVVSNSADTGDGKILTSTSSPELTDKLQDEAKTGKIKPVPPPKPLKKKEAIRKERERLRQEQEALQREREEHRQKLLLEQEELKNQKPHAADASALRLDPLPSLIKPQLTPPISSPPKATSRNNHGAQGALETKSSVPELMGPPVVKRKPPPRGNAIQNEAWGQQKMPSVWKQNHDSLPESRYNQNHWLIQEAEMRRITELKERQRAAQLASSQPHLAEDEACSNSSRVPVIPLAHNQHPNYMPENTWNYGQSKLPVKKFPPPPVKEHLHTIYPREALSPPQPPSKPSRVVPMERQEQMLSVSGRKRCSHCSEELGRGAAMIIESLQLYYHIHCFQCCVCQAQLGNGSCGTDVRVRNNKLHCHNCYSNDEAGLKFSQV